ncbi:MAG: choice-of-anchor tandem repeat GloVer-containing protein [Candidatus Acidiferrales bacterium]
MSETKWAVRQGDVQVGRGRTLTRATRLGIAAATVLILAALPLQAQKETVLYPFTGSVTSGPDGASPGANLIRDASGNLYGTTQAGGSSGNGTVFELVYASGSYTEKVLYSFAGATSDGALPLAGLVMDSSGNLFGTTSLGGASNAGIVFELVNSAGSYEEKVLHSFPSAMNDGEGPQAGLVMDSKGNLYGTTLVGGSSSNGTVFEMANSSGGYTENVLYSFSGKGDGGLPYAGLMIDASGKLYGTTSGGGVSGTGTVFEIDNSSGSYVETVLYSFTGTGADGRGPIAGVIMDSSGNLFGTTQFGGTSTACGTKLGCGVVFELVNSDGYYLENPLHTFAGLTGGDGGTPLGLVMDSSGNLYGVTEVGGATDTSSTCVYGCGTVFELSSAQAYSETILYTFPSFAGDGLVPDAALVLDSSDKLLYGITSSGGYTTASSGGVQTACPFGCGTVFEITYGSAAPASTISATSGSGQTATVGQTFSAPFVATVVNSSGTGVSGVTVTFSAFASGGGASGTFAGGVNTAITNASGVATSAPFAANGTAGSYSVTATAPNVSGAASFTLTNIAAQVSTMVTVTTASSDHGDALPSGDALVGNPITVSFKVAQASGTVTPTGNVVVSDDNGDTCIPSPVVLTAAAAGAGSCTWTIASLPASGMATVKATYTPDTNTFSGNSASVTESVVEIFACGPSVPEQVVKQGATITYSFTVCVAGNANAVPLVADVVDCVPRGKCTLAVTELGQTGVYTVAVTIVTDCGDCKTLIVPQPSSRPGAWPVTVFWFCALTVLIMASLLKRRRQKWVRVAFMATFLFAIVMCGMSACAGNSNDAPVGMYTVSVKAVAGNFSVVVPANVMIEK